MMENLVTIVITIIILLNASPDKSDILLNILYMLAHFILQQFYEVSTVSISVLWRVKALSLNNLPKWHH